MKSISHSQFTSYNECNLKWKLRYIDELSLSSGNIYTLFGSAMHTVIQEYLVTMYNKSIVEAEKLDLETRLKEEMVNESALENISIENATYLQNVESVSEK